MSEAPHEPTELPPAPPEDYPHLNPIQEGPEIGPPPIVEPIEIPGHTDPPHVFEEEPEPEEEFEGPEVD